MIVERKRHGLGLIDLFPLWREVQDLDDDIPCLIQMLLTADSIALAGGLL